MPQHTQTPLKGASGATTAPIEIPAALESERSVLAAVLVRPDALPEVRAILGPDGSEMYDGRNRLIYEAILHLWDHGVVPDFATITDYADSRGQSDAMGGMHYLADLLASDANAYAATSYANMVSEAAIKRRALDGASELAKLATSPQTDSRELQARTSELVQRIFHTNSGLWRGRVEGGSIPGRVLDRQVLLAEMREKGQEMPGLVVGIPPVDRLLGPLGGGNLMMILAPTSTGKTSLMMQSAIANAKRGFRPVFYFNELSMNDVQNRIVVMESIDWGSWIERKAQLPMPAITVEELERGIPIDDPRLTNVLGQVSAWSERITFQPAHGWSASEIAEDFQSLYMRGMADQVYVDYLDLVEHKARSDNDSDAIGEKLMVLKNAAAACKTKYTDGIPIVVSCQPPKAASLDNTRPSISDSFGSVRPGQYSSKFITLWRQRDDKGVATGYTMLRIEKNPALGNEGREVHMIVAGDRQRRGYAFAPVKVREE